MAAVPELEEKISKRIKACCANFRLVPAGRQRGNAVIKILFFIEKLGGGGAEKVLRDLVDHLDQSKFDITVQSVWPYPEGRQLKPGIKYKSVYPRRNRFTERLFQLEAALGLTYRLRIKKRYDIEAAYLEFAPTKILAGSTNRRAVKFAWVHCDLKKAIKDYVSFEEKCAPWYSKYDQVVCVSQTVKDSFDHIFHNRFSSVVLSNYIDEQAIKTRAEEEIGLVKPEGKRIILAIGTLYPPKNYPRLLRAFSKIHREFGDLVLWILGDGEQKQALQDYTAELGLQESVSFFGFQTNPYPYMKISDYLVCSSNYEGYSTVITEGLILGKTIVTTDCSGMGELLGDSEYGLITENNDEAFYLGLRRIISDPKLSESYRKKASEKGAQISGAQIVRNTEEFFMNSYLTKRETNP
jgi:glycosyltransferase involved in cell wall biosynthesis